MKVSQFDKSMLWLIGSLLADMVMVIGFNVAALIKSWLLAGISAGFLLLGLFGIGMGLFHGLRIGGKHDS